ncbi:peptidase inhibitor family I36 protein [Streptomyces virginiae]|uniref:peptidase inhibitor family I36 protein n=1 Tax=Streptomyces virginiae TaxID=1961 RepID=UPI003716992B
MRTIRRAMAVALPAAAALAFGVAPAQASSGYDIWCNGYHANCGTFYYNSNLTGSRISFTGTNGWEGEISNLSGYTYLESGKAGYGQPVKNNAASFYNGSMQKATVFYNSGFAGACDAVASLTNVNKLNKTYNQNASLGFGSRTGSNCYMFN